MPQIIGSTSILTGVTNANVLSGLLFERVGGRGAQIKLFAVVTTVGNYGEMTCTLIAGSDVLVQDAVLNENVLGPQVPRDSVAAGVALPGDQLVLSITNNGAGTNVAGWIVDITNA